MSFLKALIDSFRAPHIVRRAVRHLREGRQKYILAVVLEEWKEVPPEIKMLSDGDHDAIRLLCQIEWFL